MGLNRKGFEFELRGDKELKKIFNELPKRAQKSGMRKAITAGSTPVAKAAKRNAPRDSGLLKKSIKKKIKTYSNGNVVGIIGADRATAGIHEGKKRVPANYIHLVEKGTSQGAPATRFLEKAFNETKDQAQEIVKKKLDEAIHKEHEKMKAKGIK